MLLSQVEYETMLAFSDDIKGKVVYDGVSAEMPIATDFAFLLGGPEYSNESRAKTCADLYKAGKVKYIIASGKPERDSEFGKKAECDILADYLVSFGVPKDAIIAERQALTTVENMIFSAVLMQRKIHLCDIRAITVVTSYEHLKRSMALAKAFLPKSIKVYGYPSTMLDETPSTWRNSEIFRDSVANETRLLWWLAYNKVIDDIEF